LVEKKRVKSLNVRVTARIWTGKRHVPPVDEMAKYYIAQELRETIYTGSGSNPNMPMVVDIGTLIERSPDIRKGRPCIAGTGVTVRRIAGWHNLGLTPEEIAAKIEHLTLAQIHAALAYYHANRDEIDSDIAAEEVATEAIFPPPAKLM
jgi:uncharacterized protein (DUF433 family)